MRGITIAPMGLNRWLLAGLSLLVLLPSQVGADDATWQTDYDAALKQAVEQKRPLLIHFYGTYCPPCRRMDREVLHTRETRDLLAAKFVAVKIDAGDGTNPQSMRLVQQFGIDGLPADVVVDPLTGRVITQTSGYQDQRLYISSALRSSSRFEQSHKTLLAKDADQNRESQKASQSTTNSSEAVSAIGEIHLGEPQPLVGLGGYSPVSLVSARDWVKGKAEFAWDYKGITYHLASKDEYEQFRADPDEFAPRLLGCDPVILSDTERAVPGEVKYGAFYDGELYLFSTADTRKRFKTNPPRYIRVQHVLKVDRIERTASR